MILVLVFVAGTVRQAWGELQAQPLALRWEMLLASGIVYLVALLPMAFYWRIILLRMNQPCRWRELLPAYYLGHLGKYVPGKAMVVVLRTVAMKQAGADSGPVAVSVFVETITMMATGAAIGAGLLATGNSNFGEDRWLIAIAVGVAIACAAVTSPRCLRWVLNKIGSKKKSAQPAREKLKSLDLKTTLLGWLLASTTWVGLSLSLWLAALGCGFQPGSWFATWQTFLLAATLPVALGFVSLLPGGLLVRDGLMLKLLTPVLGSAGALATAAAARLIWVASELAVYGIMKVTAKLLRPPPA